LEFMARELREEHTESESAEPLPEGEST